MATMKKTTMPKKKMAMGRTNKKPLRKADNGTIVGSTTPPAGPRDPKLVPGLSSTTGPYSTSTPTMGGKPLTPAEVAALNKQANIKRLTGRKQGGATKVTYKKPLKKAQPGLSTGTPFQNYLKNTTGAVPSDTVMKTLYPGDTWDAPKSPVAKNPKNQNLLEKVYEQTYGQGWKSESGQPAKDETFEQYKRRMGPLKKTGGAKMAKGGMTKAKKMAKGGASSFGMLSVKAGIDKNPKATAADRIAGAKKKKRK